MTEQVNKPKLRSASTTLGNVTLNYDYNEKGKIIYKASTIVPFKKNGALKAKYADLPKYKLILTYEDHTKKMFDNEVLLKSVKEINSKLKSYAKA